MWEYQSGRKPTDPTMHIASRTVSQGQPQTRSSRLAKALTLVELPDSTLASCPYLPTKSFMRTHGQHAPGRACVETRSSPKPVVVSANSRNWFNIVTEEDATGLDACHSHQVEKDDWEEPAHGSYGAHHATNNRLRNHHSNDQKPV